MGSNPTGRYSIRLFEPGDEDGFLKLYDTVFGGGSREWFKWKYVDNPYLIHIPIFVAEYDGRIVGARPYMGFRLVVNDERVLGLQTGDTMVHPDHRRRGLFSRMTKRSFDYYGGLAEQIITFNVPNALSRPGYIDLGCVQVGQLPLEYRIQRPSAMIHGTDNTIIHNLGRYASPLVRRAHQSAERMTGIPDDVTVRRHRSIPIDTFVSLYQRSIPDGVHALRDPHFYGWRFENPTWEYTTYTAQQDGEAVAGAIVGEKSVDGKSTVYLTELLPLSSGAGRRDGVKAIVAAMCQRYRDADVVAVAKGHVPTTLLRRVGFFPDDRLPLSKLASPTILITRVLDGSDRPTTEIGDVNLQDPDNWHLSLSERNTS